MLYTEAAAILESVAKKHGSPKSLVLSGPHKNKKQLYALVCETLKYADVLQKIIANSKLQEQERILKVNNALTQVLTYDLLFGKGLQGQGKFQKAIYRHKTRLNAELARLKVKEKVISNKDLLPDEIKNRVALPRYVRVNLIKASVEEIIQHFQTEGYTLLPSGDQSRSVDTVKQLKRKQFVTDYHIPELLVFSPGTDFHKHSLYTEGKIVLQDKASCMPAFILDPPPGSHVIDSCAAPGNKTSHMASIMKNQGKIYSFDISSERLAVMKTLTQKAGVTCAELCRKDFLKVDSSEKRFSNVEYMLVDPSCSGSGIISRQDYLTDKEDISSDRLQNLANFQVTILKHALSFPSIRRVVYSTCSVHKEENELVVQEVMKAYSTEFYVKSILGNWCHRGLGITKHDTNCLRFSPKEDLTNGFFVACFERKEQATTGSKLNHCESNCGNTTSKRKKRKHKKKSKKLVSIV